MSDITTFIEVESRTLKQLEATVEKVTGQTAANLRAQTLTQLRSKTEAKNRRNWVFASRFPVVGRGSVMRERVMRHEDVEGLLTRFLR